MTWLLETPVPAIVGGVLLAAMIGAGWLRTGRGWLLGAMVAVLVLTVTAVIVERLVITDREQVDATLHEIARLVEKNDIDAALPYAHSRSPAVRAQADAELRQYKFQQITIARNLEIEVQPKHLPPKATATFNVIVTFGTKDGQWAGQRLVRYVEVTMLQESDGRWRVAAYAHDDPLQGLRTESRRGNRPPGGRSPAAKRASYPE